MRFGGFAFVAVLSAVALVGCGQGEEERAAAEAEALVEELAAGFPVIRYSVGGSTSQASITVRTPTGTSQQSDIDVPLRSRSGEPFLRFVFERGEFVYISAQNSLESGSVSCRIENGDGEVIASNQASGAFAIASCEGRAR